MICIIKTEKARGNAGNTSRFSTASLEVKEGKMNLSDSESKKVRIILLVLMVLWFLVDIAIYLIQREHQTLVRMFLTGLLFFYIFKGKNWARKVFLALSVLGISVGILMAIYLAYENLIVGAVFIVFVLFLSVLPCYLAFNKTAKLYFAKPEAVEA